MKMMDFDPMAEARCLVAYHGSLYRAIEVCEKFTGVNAPSSPEEKRRTAETLRALRRLK